MSEDMEAFEKWFEDNSGRKATFASEWERALWQAAQTSQSARMKELEAENARLLRTFAHIHVNRTSMDDDTQVTSINGGKPQPAADKTL